jgi:hypothetical protein
MGSKSTQSTQIPEYVEEAGKLALQRAQEIQAMGYVPYTGPEVAAINPYEQASAANVGGMAAALGMQAPVGVDMGGMPTVTQGGMTGYSSYPAYMASLERLRETRPEMYQYFSGMTRFDPITGALNPEYDARMQAAIAPQVAAPVSGGGGSNNDGLSHAEIMEMHYGNPAGSNANLGPRDSSPRPVLRSQSTGGSGNLFSGLRDAREEVSNRIYTALGGRG